MPSAPELTKHHVRRLNKCLVGTRNEHRDRCFMMMLLYSGCRIAEPLQLNMDDVLTPDGDVREYATLKKTKNGEQRRIYFASDLHPYIHAYLEDMKHNWGGFFFGSSQSKGGAMHIMNAHRLVRTALNTAGLTEHKSHSFRRSTAIHLRRMGIDFEVIRTILGHKDLRQTQTYFAGSTIEASEALTKLKF